MRIIVKHNNEYSLVNIPENNLKTYHTNYDEIFENPVISDEELKLIEHGAEFTYTDKINFTDTTLAEQNIQNSLESKMRSKKREEINEVASLSDQLNLLAMCVEVLAEGNDDPRLNIAKEKFNEIKTILNK